MTMHLTAIIEREGDSYVALCPQLDIASQGETVTEARENLGHPLARLRVWSGAGVAPLFSGPRDSCEQLESPR